MSSLNTNMIWRWVRHWFILCSGLVALYFLVDNFSINNSYSSTLTPGYSISIDTELLTIIIFCVIWSIGLLFYQLVKKWTNRILNFTQLVTLSILVFVLFALDHNYTIGIAVIISTYLLYCIYRTIKNYRVKN